MVSDSQYAQGQKKPEVFPIIFPTAFKSEEFQHKGYEVGAVDYLLKPIDDNLLINKISTYFRLIQKEREMNLVLEQKGCRAHGGTFRPKHIWKILSTTWVKRSCCWIRKAG